MSSPGPIRLRPAPDRYDLIVANLFLHHFEPAPLRRLLAGIASAGDAFFACEPRRAPLALAGSHLIGAIGVNAVTREDAVLSVHAGFRGRELGDLWPAERADWELARIRAPDSSVIACWRGARRRLMRSAFDVVIVGAGPAGSSAAIRLARAGWSVALVEKQSFPRRKVCGECIAASNLDLIDDLGIGPAFAAAAGPPLRRVALWRGEDEVSAASAGRRRQPALGPRARPGNIRHVAARARPRGRRGDLPALCGRWRSTALPAAGSAGCVRSAPAPRRR